MRFEGIIAALWRRVEDVPTDTVFLLRGEIENIAEDVRFYKLKGKRVLVDMDFVEGLGGGEHAIRFLKNEAGADGVITVKLRNYLIARKLGIPAVLRFFALDSRAVEKGLAQIEANDVGVVEVLPGVAVFKVVKRMKDRGRFNIIAAGLVDNERELWDLLKVADAVSTSTERLWYARGDGVGEDPGGRF